MPKWPKAVALDGHYGLVYSACLHVYEEGSKETFEAQRCHYVML